MSGYTFVVTCVACAAPLEHTAGGTSNGTETSAVATCSACSLCHYVRVTLAVLTDRPRAEPRRRPGDSRCGTTAGYQAHRVAGTVACAACKEAHAHDQRRRRAAVKA
jgi:hypothetical protein